MDISEVIDKLKNDEISKAQAEQIIRKSMYEDMSFARLDTNRKSRQGAAEVIYCAGKKDEYLVEIFKKLYEFNGEVMGTRATKEQFFLVKNALPEAVYDEESRIIRIESSDKIKKGKIVVCTAGTADIPVAKEAAVTASFLGANVVELFDVGVSGIHRLLSNIDVFDDANCVVAVAGMEGALASVIGGLVSCPVIAVPTSVGYGASFGGLSALLTMINSCSNGIAVVNIDNGYGAGYMAAQINRQSEKNN